MRKIHILPNLLINQIAAGEVIQRPASIVKELIDNAVDAQSTTIKIIIKQAGKQLIQVQDNGIGMSDLDASMCFTKHATSKITSLSDLSNITTLGFRGEALASIAAVAQVEMATRQHDVPIGTSVILEGGVIQKQEPIATGPGTTVSVKNLFYNTPARRNFLKSDPIEFKHIIEEVQHAALARPDISFSLYHNDITIYNLQAAKTGHRIIHLFGDHYKNQLIPCKQSTSILTIKGYLGRPEQAKKTRKEQFLFVNQRFIKSHFINHAIKQAYGDLMHETITPFYVIYLTVDPTSIDVNVHPTKTEVKFQDQASIYSLIQAVIKKTLATSHINDSLDFEQNMDFEALQYSHPVNTAPKFKEYTPIKRYDGDKKEPIRAGSKDIEILFQNESKPPIQEVDQKELQIRDYSKFLQLYKNYIITQVHSGALIIDQQAAYERILYDRLQANLKNGAASSQALLIPEKVHLNPKDYMIIMDHMDILKSLGFIIDPFGESTIIIHGCPTEFCDRIPKSLIEELLEQWKNHGKMDLTKSERIIRALTTRSSSIQSKQLSSLEINELLVTLFSSNNTIYAPDGRKICVLLQEEDIVNFFK